MKLIRFYFTKKGEAAYISHLDLQRVMARALRRAKIPVWYSQGFNPHIYMTFSLPLPLMQDSICETMDCKTEADDADFSMYIPALNNALPKGIDVSEIADPVYKAEEIAGAQYLIRYTATESAALLPGAVQKYNTAEKAETERRTKRTKGIINLKEILPAIGSEKAEQGIIEIVLPAGTNYTINPELLLNYFEECYSLPLKDAHVTRTAVITKSGEVFK